jgi:hypothetical protein
VRNTLCCERPVRGRDSDVTASRGLSYGLRVIDSGGAGFPWGIEKVRMPATNKRGRHGAVVGHLSLAELQAGYRGSGDATLARHYQVVWLLAQRSSRSRCDKQAAPRNLG